MSTHPTFARLFIFAIMTLVLFFALSITVHAATWTGNYNVSLSYFWNNGATDGSCNRLGCGWALGLLNPSVTVNYSATAFVDGSPVSSGATIPVGSIVTVNAVPHANTDIYWTGTGYTADTPNGYWADGAPNRPVGATCLGQDLVQKDVTVLLVSTYYTFDVYAPLVISKPTVTYLNSGTANLIPISGNSFQVGTAGTVNLTVRFGATQGKFYYSYLGKSAALINGNPTPWPVGIGGSQGVCRWNVRAMRPYNNVTGPDFTISVPYRDVTFSFNAETPGSPPNPPTIDGPNDGITHNWYTFGFTATDVDGDNVAYEIDWDASDGVDEVNQTTSPYVLSGARSTADKQWVNQGVASFKARTVDSNGLRSDWTDPYTIDLSPPAIPTGLSGTPSAVCDSGEINLTWNSSTGAVGYQIRIDGDDTNLRSVAVTSYTATGLTPPGSDHSFQVRAGFGSSWSDWSDPAITVSAPPACLADFDQPIGDSDITLSYDAANTVYNAIVAIDLTTFNVGEAPTPNDATYAVMLDLNDDGDFDDVNERQTGTIPAGLSHLPTPPNNNRFKDTVNFSMLYATYPDYLFGPMRVRLEVDTPVSIDGSGVPDGSVPEENENDNYLEFSINVDAPDPQLSITADKDLVRGDTLFNLDWSVAQPYEDLLCDIVGPGLDQSEIDPNSDVDLLTPGIQIDPTRDDDLDASSPPFDGRVTNVGPIDAKSVYTFRCIEQTSTKQFTAETSVDFLAVPEEI